MNTTDQVSTRTIPAVESPRRRRLMAVVAAVGAALATFAMIEGVADVDLQTPGFGLNEAQDLAFPAVLMASALAGATAWGLLALLERWTSRPRRYWTIVVTVGFLISIGGPMSGTGISQSNRLLLVLLHAVVAVVLIPLLYRTARPERSGR